MTATDQNPNASLWVTVRFRRLLSWAELPIGYSDNPVQNVNRAARLTPGGLFYRGFIRAANRAMLIISDALRLNRWAPHRSV